MHRYQARTTEQPVLTTPLLRLLLAKSVEKDSASPMAKALTNKATINVKSSLDTVLSWLKTSDPEGFMIEPSQYYELSDRYSVEVLKELQVSGSSLEFSQTIEGVCSTKLQNNPQQPTPRNPHHTLHTHLFCIVDCQACKATKRQSASLVC